MLTPEQRAEIKARAAQANDLKGDVLLRAQIVDTDVPALLAEVERLNAKLGQPCGSCHPCTNYADETWREAGRTPPHVYQWDGLREDLDEIERLAYMGGQDAETVRRMILGVFEKRTRS